MIVREVATIIVIVTAIYWVINDVTEKPTCWMEYTTESGAKVGNWSAENCVKLDEIKSK